MERNHRILIVDDNEAIHEDYRKILAADAARDASFDRQEAEIFNHAAIASGHQGFDLSFASQGAQALQLVEQFKKEGRSFSLAFVDVRMPPGWDGLKTTAKLWDVDPDLQIVICTAYSDKSWEEMSREFKHPERVLILKKPFDTIEVLQLAHALTEKWSLLQTSRHNMRELETTVQERTRELVAANVRLEQEAACHKAAAEQVREQAMILEKARDAIIVRDLDDKILFWNQGATNCYGWTAREAIGRTTTDLLAKEPQCPDDLAARQTVLTQGGWNGELTQTTKDGLHITTECRCTLLLDADGVPKSILSINNDITERKSLEQQFLRAQRMESIGTLAGGISHDLNNVLAPIMMSIDILRDHVTDPGALEVLEMVAKSAQRGANLVSQVLTYARGVDGMERVERGCHGRTQQNFRIVKFQHGFPIADALDQHRKLAGVGQRHVKQWAILIALAAYRCDGGDEVPTLGARPQQGMGVDFIGGFECAVHGVAEPHDGFVHGFHGVCSLVHGLRGEGTCGRLLEPGLPQVSGKSRMGLWRRLERDVAGALSKWAKLRLLALMPRQSLQSP